MAKKGKLKSYAQIKGKGNQCPHCRNIMERRMRIKPPKNKSYFYTEWDYCPICSHIQHYNEFKSQDWKESEQQQLHFFSI